MALACWALMVSLPIVMALYWINASAADLAEHINLAANAIRGPLQMWQRWAGGAVMGLPLLILLVGMWHAKRCFDQFANGQVFVEFDGASH